MKILKLFSYLFAFGTAVAHRHHFSYDFRDKYGPFYWKQIPGCTECGGKRQSPIDIITSESNSGLGFLTIHNAALVPDSITLKNNGHEVAYFLNFPYGQQVTLTGGPLLNQTYILHNFHMHWPSEHLLNGVLYNAEMHMVFYKSNYRRLKNAINNQDGVAVLAFFYEVESTFKRFNHIFDALNDVLYAGSTGHITKNITSLNEIIGTEPFAVYSYPGSLTTPNCREVVTWMVCNRTIPMSLVESFELRQLRFKDKARVLRNNRPIQPTNGREIVRYDSILN